MAFHRDLPGRQLVGLAAIAAAFSVPAGAQIRFMNPFAMQPKVLRPFVSPQGSVTPLATTGTCALPAAPLSSGLQPKPFTWLGYKWNNDSGQTWNGFVPYAIKTCSNGHIVFELHDTSNDHGQNDPSNKRRTEIGATATGEKFYNNTTYWHAFSFSEHWDCPSCMRGSEVTIMQMHWPSGASPAFAFRAVGYNGSAGFRITTRGDNQGNINRYTGPLSLDTVHDVVYEFKLNGVSGDLDVWLDGKLVLDLHGVPIGSTTEDGYTFRVGSYGQLNGNRVVAEYTNIAPFPSSNSLSGRVAAAPSW
jgi:hypothetical protein